jgi:predicted phosphoadenosine phosphosulfate sulfurtransferase
MATNLALDDNLIIQAQKIGHHRTKKEAVMMALKEYIAHKKQLKILDLFGHIDFNENYDITTRFICRVRHPSTPTPSSETG